MCSAFCRLQKSILPSADAHGVAAPRQIPDLLPAANGISAETRGPSSH